ncbi:MAG TPA: hypothetical protein VFZ61_29920 [Polyangiales bacterium]
MTIFKSPRGLGLASAFALLALSACDDSSSSEKDSGSDAEVEEDAAVEEDSSVEEDGGDDLDGGAGDGSTSDGGTSDGGFAAISDQTIKTTISATGHDRFYAVTHDKDGNIFAVGQSATTNYSGAAASDKSDYSVVLVKYKPSGELDTGFGDKGVVLKNVVAVGNGANAEVARGVVVQSTGKIVVAATVPHTPAGAGTLASDTDIALLRFNANGTPDDGFGTAGVKIHDITTAHEYQPPTTDAGVPPPALSAADQQYALQLGADDKLVLLGVTLGQGDKAAEPGVKRTDSDWLLTRLTADGELDTSFATKGYVTLDIAEGGASARGVTVLKDGSLIGAGYTTVANVLDAERRQQPVLFKVKPDGSFDAEFAKADKYDAKPGVFYDFVTPGKTNAEAYGFVAQGDKFITLGYGPTNVMGGTGTDFVYARFNADGSQDKGFGTGGASFVDFGTYGDNGRALVVLDDKRIVGVGGGRAKPETPPAMANAVPVDGAVSVLLPDGQPDTAFGTNGQKLFNLGGPSDFFWGASQAPDHKSVAIVGIASAADSGGNDDGSLVILKLQ